ncbi:hypothetical protein ILUMI_09350 [Ignelater luminosus]|uniref:CRAL-TRIO domain-containing protein n=1 Tax=Ignelater luminosus TaxID=2038154 RepID=A0A8K0D2K8_IGNLU|nr:hypothetical protein ILUMI_09350 [Ignelater luminosus]
MIPDDYTFVDYTGGVLNKKEINEKIEELRKLVLNDKKLMVTRTDDPYLLRFLYSTDFSVIAAFTRVSLLQHDKLLAHWFKSVLPSERQGQLQLNSKGILQCRDNKGRPIYLIKLARVDASLSNPKKEFQFDKMWFESIFDDLKTQANGIKFVVHIVNTLVLLNAAVKIVWSLLNGKIKKQVKFHFNNWNSLHEHISADVLPPEYGGSGPDIDFEDLTKWLLDQESRIRKNLEYRQHLQSS